MANAYSKSNSSLSSTLPNVFLKMIGFQNFIDKNVVRPDINTQISKSYTSLVRDYAQSKDRWKYFADKLNVDIVNGTPKVTVNGSEEDQLSVNLLEYGTPGNPPNSVIRVMEEELRQRYTFDSKGYFSE